MREYRAKIVLIRTDDAHARQRPRREIGSIFDMHDAVDFGCIRGGTADRTAILDAIDSVVAAANDDSVTANREPADCERSCAPYCAINANSPAVFRATVFPPVLGPVIRRLVAGGMILIVTGTAFFNRGCRAA